MQAKQKDELKSEIAVENDEYKNEYGRVSHSEKLSHVIEKRENRIRIRIARYRRAELIICHDSKRNSNRQIEYKKHEIDNESRNHESKLFVSELAFRLFVL